MRNKAAATRSYYFADLFGNCLRLSTARCTAIGSGILGYDRFAERCDKHITAERRDKRSAAGCDARAAYHADR